MGQTGIIFFALLVGFIVFITMKQELGQYLATLGLGGETAAQRAARTAADLQKLKDTATRINDSLKPLG